MRLASVLLFVAFAMPGCFGIACQHHHGPGTDCSYGVGPAYGSTWFLDDDWNETRFALALRDMGYTVSGTETGVVGHAGQWDLVSSAYENGTTELAAFYGRPSGGLGLTLAEAQAEANETTAQARAGFAPILADLEARTGWSHDSEPTWSVPISVA